MENICSLSLGTIIKGVRKSKGLSQKELCQALDKQFGLKIDFQELGKIECDRINIQDSSYDFLVQCLCKYFELNADWVQDIRLLTEAIPYNHQESQAIFPVYYDRKQSYDRRI